VEGDPLDQTRAPFFDALAAYAGTAATPFSTPGHKQGRGAPQELRALLPDTLELDIPHAGGVDTTHMSLGLLREAERLAAAAYGGDMARFLVNGSTTGNLAMLLSTCASGDGDTVIVSRMLHKSLLTGLIFSGARPHYLIPAIDDDRNLPLDIETAAVAGELDVYPDAKAVVIVSPSYVGVSSDLSAIAGICHARGVPLLVDEAWGPHFHFHPSLPLSAMASGADAAVSSTHKMLAGLTQSSTLVARAGLLDLERMSTIVDMVQTTSPSALIYASLDASRRQMALDGHRLLDDTLALAQRLRTGLAAIDGLDVLSPTLVDDRAGAGFDLTRVIIDVHGLGLTGYEAEHALRTDHGVYVEMSDLLSVMLLVTIGDDVNSIDRAIAGFQLLTALRKAPRHAVAARSSGDLLFAQLAELTPREAFIAPSKVVSVAHAAGRVSVESITPYPPGIPLVAPGERLTQDVIDYLRAGIEEGMYVSGLADTSFATVRVVR
jgi:arginine/lysine/ornithine decarboxylase